MNIHDRTEHDPVADIGMPNNYMRWALEAIEEVAGTHGLTIILRKSGLEALRDNFPPDNDDFDGLTGGQYSDLNAAILTFFGRRARSLTMRIGRVSSRRAIDGQARLFNIAALLTLKVMPLNTQLKLGLGQMQEGFRKIWAANDQYFAAHLKETDEAWYYVADTCPMCAGKVADEPICWLFAGTLHESLQWLTGKGFHVFETECRAIGAQACVWRISKKPKE